MPSFRLLLSPLAATLALSSSACTQTSSCDRDAELVQVPAQQATVEGVAGSDSGVAEGIDRSIVDGNTYYSSKFGGPYQYFPPATTLNFDLSKLNALSSVIPVVQFWLAFTEGGTLAPSAGNMTELRTSDKDPDQGPALKFNRVSVRNNTCSDFYLWVVATTPTH